MLLQPIPHHVIVAKASTAIYSLSRCTRSHWPSPGHVFLLIHLFVFIHADFLQTGWSLHYSWAQSSSTRALLLPDQCPQKVPTALAMAGRERQKKSRGGKECTVLYRWFAQTQTTPLFCAPKGADAISVSVVLCVFLTRAFFYFESHRRELTSIKFDKLPIK